uniref:RUN domain-containing protein n=1 Tax=Meloidogyne javanica TaxID=6303 RepID=A0A915N4U6_MELJA
MGERLDVESKAFIAAKNSIRRELDLSAEFASKNFALTATSEFAHSICSLIEAILIHGLRDAFFIRGSRYSKRPIPNFWPFVSKYTHRSIKQQIYVLNQIKTEVGKARAWIRIVLCERTLESYINLFSKDAQINQFYKKGAFIRDTAYIDSLNVYLQKLDKLTIVAPTNSNLLNNWTPNPLILAGLIPGKFTNCYNRIGEGSISSPYASSDAVAIDNSLENSADQNSPEQATNALDLLLTPPDSMTTMESNLNDYPIASISSNVLQHSQTVESPLCSTNKFGKQIGGYVKECLVDDNESVISHPSMIYQCEDESLFEKLPKTPKTFADWKRYGAAATSRLRRLSPSLIGADAGCGAEFDTAFEGDDDVFCLGKNAGPSEEQSSEFPPLGSSLQDELLLAERMEQEASKEVEERDELPPSHQISITSNTSDVLRKNSSPPTLEMFNITAIDSTDSSTTDLPATFDEALRAFLSQGDKTNNRLFQSESKKRLFSECSSSVGELNKLSSDSLNNLNQQILSPPLRSLSLQSSSTNVPFPNLIEIQPFTEQNSNPNNCQFSNITTTSLLSTPYKLPKRFYHLINIPNEKGLDAQNFRCKTCCRNIGVGFGHFKECALNGYYYCEDCFKSGGESLIPSRAILNADFKPRSISNASRVLLQSIMDQPLFRIDFLNPYIYEHSKNIRKIRDIRKKLGYSVMYLLSCKNSVANDIRRRLWPHNHLHSDIHAYSLMDLECVANGTLERRLNTLLTSTLSHIWDCPLCLQKCPNCSSCFHRSCSNKLSLKEEEDVEQNNEDVQKCQQNTCPKCLRKAKLASGGRGSAGLLSSTPSLLNLSPGSSQQL